MAPPKRDFGSEARWWTSLPGGAVECGLCPRRCRVSDGEYGFCRARVNRGGRFFSEVWGRPAAVHIDPIEKKPFNWYMPGSRVFSIGTFGCNLGCVFCQNHELSRAEAGASATLEEASPAAVVSSAIAAGCPAIAFTYNEPTVFAEYAIEMAKLARQRGLATLLVSNGYISDEAAAEFYPLISAANIDIKGDDAFYRRMCGGELSPVLAACRRLLSHGSHLEVTNLVLPGENDDPGQVALWLEVLAAELGVEVPLHFSASFAAYHYYGRPTPRATLERMAGQAAARGFKRVALGNVF
ncbi:MAG: AmmeMemoRadiSam system radical SAM enzyme [Victivallaceae bacterium]|nr:AmmeMemoRadiSam system radical SAM enzyme [Victivallaceae bacterium]